MTRAFLTWLPIVFAVVRCGGDSVRTVPLPIRDGTACAEPDARQIGETGCDLCTCTDGTWRCEGQDCSCDPEGELIFSGACVRCPCEDRSYRCRFVPCANCYARTDQSCAAQPTWGRDRVTGVCCKYDRPCDLPLSLDPFTTEAECNPFGCECEPEPMKPLPLGCGCPPEGCPTLSGLLETACNGHDDDYLVRRTGCGKLAIAFWGGFTAWTWLFDEGTGVLVGSSSFSDAGHGVCGHFGYAFGEPFDCDVIAECALCPGSALEELMGACAP